MRKLLLLALALLIFFLVPEANAQINRRSIKKNNKRISSYRGRKSWFGKEKVYNMIGLSVNAFNYYGDISPKPSSFSTDLGYTKPAFGVHFSHRFGPRYALTGSFMYGTLKASDNATADQSDPANGVYRYQRNLSFRNRISELSVVASLDLFENSATYISRVPWTPYVYLGVSAFLHNPQAKAPEFDLQGNPLPQAGEWVDLQPLGTEGQNAQLLQSDANYGLSPYKKLQVAIPMGLGVRFRLNEILDFSFETGFRYLFTDYIDDLSENYVDLGVFGNNELAKAMSYRSNEVATPTSTYVGRDGQSYSVIHGYGSEYPDNVRGNKNNKDIFLVTTLKITYILGKTFHRAKFR